jgi:hypothetical protein
VEHIALHNAQSVCGPQFYISCGQLDVTGGGAGVPTPLVASLVPTRLLILESKLTLITPL